MITFKVEDFVNRNVKKTKILGVYIVKCRETALYVGKSSNVVRRLYEHIGKQKTSFLGEAIAINLPQSLSWQIDIMEPDDIRKIYPSRSKSTDKFTLDCGEYSAITSYRPCLNRSNNLTPTAIPSDIKSPFLNLTVGLTDNLY